MDKTLNLPESGIAQPLVSDIFNGLKAIFDDTAIVGFYLGGSLAIGDFDESKSDLDFVVVLKAAPTHDEVEELRNMHNATKSSHKNRLYDNYEGVYITQGQALKPKNTNMHAAHLGSDGHFEIESHGPEIIIDLWQIRKAGFVVFGQSPEGVIGKITDDELLQANIDLFKSWWLPKLERREPMDSEYQAYTILTMARILYSLANHEQVSKKKAAAWCIEHYDKQAGLIREAFSWEPGKELNEIGQVYDLISLVDEQVTKSS
ncbi:MAG TPA: aminoglycoside adenylyltransferase domain-containing protein [Patescibacteria group bacterium]|nr:aminoglycoside adenylyltransferase domain-containing protein [Patescibacteria group bacterium]